MAENSKISWTTHTVNLWWGCSKVHKGCDNCYAENWSKRFGDDIWGKNSSRKLIKSAFNDLKRYQKQAKKNNELVKVFIGSMMDIFEESKSLIGMRERYVNTATLRENLFAEITEGKYPNVIFLFLTKRPTNIIDNIPYEWINNTPTNVWFGTSISTQYTVGYLDSLRLVSNTNLFLSIEPQVEEINDINLDGIGWVIQGCESGSKKRKFDINWARIIRDKCEYYKVPYFLKQIQNKEGSVVKEITEFPKDLQIQQFPKFNDLIK